MSLRAILSQLEKESDDEILSDEKRDLLVDDDDFLGNSHLEKRKKKKSKKKSKRDASSSDDDDDRRPSGLLGKGPSNNNSFENNGNFIDLEDYEQQQNELHEINDDIPFGATGIFNPGKDVQDMGMRQAPRNGDGYNGNNGFTQMTNPIHNHNKLYGTQIETKSDKKERKEKKKSKKSKKYSSSSSSYDSEFTYDSYTHSSQSYLTESSDERSKKKKSKKSKKSSKDKKSKAKREAGVMTDSSDEERRKKVMKQHMEYQSKMGGVLMGDPYSAAAHNYEYKDSKNYRGTGGGYRGRGADRGGDRGGYRGTGDYRGRGGHGGRGGYHEAHEEGKFSLKTVMTRGRGDYRGRGRGDYNNDHNGRGGYQGHNHDGRPSRGGYNNQHVTYGHDPIPGQDVAAFGKVPEWDSHTNGRGQGDNQGRGGSSYRGQSNYNNNGYQNGYYDVDANMEYEESYETPEFNPRTDKKPKQKFASDWEETSYSKNQSSNRSNSINSNPYSTNMAPNPNSYDSALSAFKNIISTEHDTSHNILPQVSFGQPGLLPIPPPPPLDLKPLQLNPLGLKPPMPVSLATPVTIKNDYLPPAPDTLPKPETVEISQLQVELQKTKEQLEEQTRKINVQEAKLLKQQSDLEIDRMRKALMSKLKPKSETKAVFVNPNFKADGNPLLSSKKSKKKKKKVDYSSEENSDQAGKVVSGGNLITFKQNKEKKKSKKEKTKDKKSKKDKKSVTYVNPHATQVKYLNPNPLLDVKNPSQPAPLPPMPIGEVPVIPILPKSDSESDLPSIHSIKRDSERVGKNLVMNGKSMSSFTFTVSNNDDAEKIGDAIEGSESPPRQVVKNPLFVDRNKMKKSKIEKLAEKMKLKSKTKKSSGLLGDKPMRGRSRSPSDYSDSPVEKRGKVRNYDLDSPERRKSKKSGKVIKKARNYDRDVSTDSKSEYSSDSDYNKYKKSNKRKSVEANDDSRKSSRKSVFDRMGGGVSIPDQAPKLSKSLEKRLSSKESRESPERASERVSERKPERESERNSGRSNSERIQSEIRDVLSESNLKVTKKVVKKMAKKYQSSDSDEKMLDSSDCDDIDVKDVQKEDESDKLKRLTKQIEDRISKTIDSNSQILRGLRTPAEDEEKKVEKVPLLPLPVELIEEPENDGDFLDVDAGSSAHEETSEVSESRSNKVKSSNDSETREKQRRMQHDFFNNMAKKRQPGDVPLRKAHAHSLIAKSQGGSGTGRNSGKNSGMNSPAADV